MTVNRDQVLLDIIERQRNEALNLAAVNGAGLEVAQSHLADAQSRIAELERELAALKPPASGETTT